MPQTVSLERTAYLPDSVDIALTTQFEAHRKLPLELGGRVLRTFYVVRAKEVQTDMVYDELPPSVQANFTGLQNIHSEAPEMLLSASAEGDDTTETEQLVDDDIDYDEERFRFEKTVEYHLDGNAHLLGVSRYANFYHCEEDGDDDILDDMEYEDGNPYKNREVRQSLELWPASEVPEKRQLSTIFDHPDLVAVERRADRESLGYDLQFLELVSGYTHNVELNESTRRERIQAIMSILAFTTLNGSASEVRKFI